MRRYHRDKWDEVELIGGGMKLQRMPVMIYTNYYYHYLRGNDDALQ